MNNLLRLYGDSSEEKTVLEKDMLFATLDPTMRKVDLGQGTEIIISDMEGGGALGGKEGCAGRCKEASG